MKGPSDAASGGSKEEAKEILRRASQAMDLGLYGKVLGLVEPAMTKGLDGSERIHALLLAGVAEALRGDSDSARVHLTDGLAALESSPQLLSEIPGGDLGAGLCQLAWLRLEERRFSEAERLLKAYLAHPDTGDEIDRNIVWDGLCRVHAKAGRHQDALDASRSAASSCYAEFPTFTKKAFSESLRELGRLEEARTVIVEAIGESGPSELAPLMAEASAVEERLGNEERAADYVREAAYFLRFMDDAESRSEWGIWIGVQAWNLGVYEVIVQVGSEVRADKNCGDWAKVLAMSQYTLGQDTDCLLTCEASIGDPRNSEKVEVILRKMAIFSAARLGRWLTMRRHVRAALEQDMPSKNEDLAEWLEKYPEVTRPETDLERILIWLDSLGRHKSRSGR